MNSEAQTPAATPEESAPRKTKCTIQPYATPYAVLLEIPQEDVQARLDKAWALIAPRIPASAMTGFRPGSEAFRAHWENKQGLFAVYREQWLDVIFEAAATQQSMFVLDVTGCGVARTEGGYRLSAEIFRTPAVQFRGEVPEKVEIEVYSLHPDFIAKHTDQYIAAIVAQHEKREPIAGPIIDGVKVRVVVDAKIDGQPWTVGSGPQYLDVAPDKVFPEELYKALIGKSIGDEFDVVCESLPNIYHKDAKKRMESHVKVEEILYKTTETIEEMFARANLGTVEEMRKQVSEKVKAQMLKQREENKMDLALHQLRSMSTMGIIPTKWLKSRAEDEYMSLLARHKGKTEREVLQAHGLATKGDIVQRYVAEVADHLRDELTTLAFADHHGQTDYAAGLQKNLVKAKEFLKERLVIKEVEPLSVRKPAKTGSEVKAPA